MNRASSFDIAQVLKENEKFYRKIQRAVRKRYPGAYKRKKR